MKKFLTLAASCAALLPAAGHAEVVVHDAQAYETAKGMKVGAALMGLHSDINDKLIGAKSPIAGKVEIHNMTDDNGIMKMRKVDAVDLPGGKTTKLEPNGYHLMLMDLPAPLVPGQEFPITLDFEKAGAVIAKVKVLSRKELEETLDEADEKSDEKPGEKAGDKPADKAAAPAHDQHHDH